MSTILFVDDTRERNLNFPACLFSPVKFRTDNGTGRHESICTPTEDRLLPDALIRAYPIGAAFKLLYKYLRILITEDGVITNK